MLPLRREQRSSRVASLNHLVRLPYVAPQSLCPLSRIASNTGARSPGEELMTWRISGIAAFRASPSSRSARASSSRRCISASSRRSSATSPSESVTCGVVPRAHLRPRRTCCPSIIPEIVGRPTGSRPRRDRPHARLIDAEGEFASDKLLIPDGVTAREVNRESWRTA